MSHFIPRVVDGRESVEEPLDVRFGGEGAGADPGEAGVEGRFCVMSERRRVSRHLEFDNRNENPRKKHHSSP
jgi:hypothetical protein